MSNDQKEFYIILCGWCKERALDDDWWGNVELGIGYWHSLASAYELEMRRHEQAKYRENGNISPTYGVGEIQ